RIAGALNDIVRLYVNPTSGDPEPFGGDFLTGFDFDFNQISVRAGVSGSAYAESFLDEIRIGTTWDSVTSFAIVPEPSTHALLALGGILLLGTERLRRRRNNSPG